MKHNSDPTPSNCAVGLPDEPVPQPPAALISGGLGTWDSNGHSSFDLTHLDGPYRYHVHAQWSDAKKAVIITALAIEPKKGVEAAGISGLKSIPMEQIRQHVNTVMGSPWSGRSHIALMKEEIAELPTRRRQASPERHLVAAWIAQEAEAAQAEDPQAPSPNEAVRRFFGFAPSSKANVTRLLNECRDLGYLPVRDEKPDEPPVAYERGRTGTMDMIHQRIFLAVLDDIAGQGGEGGRLAAALREELDTAKEEPCATLELDLDAIRAMFPTKPIGDDPDAYAPLPLQAHLLQSYKHTFDRLAVSHRNEPVDVICGLLKEACREMGITINGTFIHDHAIAITERRSVRFPPHPAA
ncbi:hypothetical protein ACIPYQ_38815 [Streptomyces sp. NPDC090045]|uniref:hypothetical protein n=1 Tax=Streptomyces sp. NPDC090045 TaxID=3365927 RepID=UPI003805709B